MVLYMKYALISDIHGNYPALCAVLADAQKENVDKYIFIGDYYMCLPYPNQVIDTIKNHSNAYFVRGNEEDRIEMLSAKDKSTWIDGQFQALYWYYDEISTDNKNFLIGLPRKALIDGCLHISHWSSEFIGNVEMESFSTHKLNQYFGGITPTRTEILTFITEKLQSDDTFNKNLYTLDDGIYIFGHSHIQWYKQYNNKYFINPGSCGFPIDFTGGAPYTILDITNDEISIDERRIMYDESKCINDLRNSSLYQHEKVWNEIIIKEFETHTDLLMSFLLYVEEYANKINDRIRPYSKETWTKAYSEWEKSYL